MKGARTEAVPAPWAITLPPDLDLGLLTASVAILFGP